MKTTSIIFNHCVNSIVALSEQFLADQYYKYTYAMDVRCSLKHRKFWILLDLWVDDYGIPHSNEESVTLVDGIKYIIAARIRKAFKREYKSL